MSYAIRTLRGQLGAASGGFPYPNTILWIGLSKLPRTAGRDPRRFTPARPAPLAAVEPPADFRVETAGIPADFSLRARTTIDRCHPPPIVAMVALSHERLSTCPEVSGAGNIRRTLEWNSEGE